MTPDAYQLRATLRELLDAAITWLDDADPSREPFDAAAIEALEKLQPRASSALLKIAMVGAFSSGKSFLANGLQETLIYKELEVDGESQHKYLGLLPSLPGSTTAVPTTVNPLSDRVGYRDDLKADLKVRFLGDSDWTDIGPSTSGRIAAYVTDHDKLVVRRKISHVTREVIEVQVDLPDPAISAKIFDLPGTNAIGLTHDADIKKRINEADCFIYVTMATSALSEADLDLIRFVFKHHVRFGKPVIWVVTGIDRAQQVGFDDEQAWITTVDENNKYLQGIYEQLDGGRSFLSRGFIGVSPAYEARARDLAATDAEASARFHRRSKMDLLRGELDELITGQSGNGHLHRVALEVLHVVRAPHVRLGTELTSHRIPHIELEAELVASMSEITSAKEKIGNLDRVLKEELASTLDRVKIPFAAGSGLAGHVRRQLQSQIEQTDFTSDEDVNRYELALQGTIYSWLAADGHPDQVWRRGLEEFKEVADRELRLLLGEELAGAKAAIDLNDLDQLLAVKPKPAPDLATSQLVLQFATDVSPFAAAGLSAAGISAVGIAAAGAVSAMAAAPMAAALGLAAIATIKKQKKEIRTVLGVLREDEHNRLGELPQLVADWFMSQVSATSYAVFDAVDELTDAWMKELVDRQEILRERAEHPERKALDALILYLEGRHRAGAEIIEGLAEVAQVSGETAALNNLGT